MQDESSKDELEEPQNKNSDADESDTVDISGIEIEIVSSEFSDSLVAKDPPQSLVLDTSLAGDIRSIVASDISIDKSTQQDECLEIGWQRDAYNFDKNLTGHKEMPRTANEFDLDAEGSSAEDPSQSADLASSQAGDFMFDKSAEPGDYSFFGEEVSADEPLENPQTDMPSSFLRYFYADDVSFSAWQVLALLCLVLLMLIGGITVIDELSQIL